MSSSELVRCEECGQEFDTIDSLREHQKSEREEKELRNRGVDSWVATVSGSKDIHSNWRKKLTTTSYLNYYCKNSIFHIADLTCEAMR